MKITIKTRLLGCLAALAVSLVAIGLCGEIANFKMGQSVHSILADRLKPLQQTKAISDLYAVAIVDAAHKARAGSITSDEALKAIDQAEARIRDNWKAYLATKMTPEEQRLIDKAEASMAAADKVVARLKEVIASGDQAALSAFNDGQLYPAITPVTADIGVLFEMQDAAAIREAESAEGVSNLATIILIAMGLISVGLLAFAAHVIIKQVCGPLREMTGAMTALAAGNNDLTVPALGRQDELGLMAAAVEVFKETAIAKIKADAEVLTARTRAEQERLAATEAAIAREQAVVVSSFGVALERLAEGDLTYSVRDELPVQYEALRDNFNTAMGRLLQTMRVIIGNAEGIRAGSLEITKASDDMAKRTEQQAASLEESAAALEEITSTVKRTSEGAQSAREVVAAAKVDAECGEQVVGRAVSAMGQIEQSSSQIGQIIGVIDEIAFQTNLLALNAGVEAARAGEAGRGFAVVAQEVRALAQRSAEAAREIKALINTSTAQVSQGVDLVGQTGQALQSILAQVSRINGVVGDIAASAREQASGLENINVAIAQMDQVTQQNAAMVEESTAASHALSREADVLSKLMAQFKTGEGATAPAMQTPPPAARRPTLVHAASGRSGSAAVDMASWQEF